MLWNGSGEGGDVTSECEEDEGTGSEDGDSDSGKGGQSDTICVLHICS